MDVAIYARHSSDKQTTSTTDQVARCRKFCAVKGYEVSGVFADEGISGAHLLNRPGIADLMSAALALNFERIVAEDLSRFSRDQGDMANFYKRMTFLGVTIETVTEGVVNELHIGLKGTMNALYLKDLGDKTRRGMVAAVLNGRIPGGAIYGYDVVHKIDERGELIRGLRKINDKQAAIVINIFNDYARGTSLMRICKDLNALGIPSPSGGEWGQTTLVGSAARKTGLLRNSVYKGVVVFNRMRYRKHPDTGKRLSIMNPESEWVEVPVPELAIIKPSLFDKVQKALDARSTARRETVATNQVLSAQEKTAKATAQQRAWRAQQAAPTRPRRITSGKLWCAVHGAKINPLRGGVLSCGKKGCANGYLRYEVILPAILDAATLAVTEQALLDHFDGPVVAAEAARVQADLDAAQERLAAARKEVGNVLAAVGGGRRTDQVKEWLDDREKGIRRLCLDIDGIKDQLKRLSRPQNAQAILDRYTALLRRLRVDPGDLRANKTLKAAFVRFDVGAEWNEGDRTWERSCRAEIDLAELVRVVTDRSGSVGPASAPPWRNLGKTPNKYVRD